MSADKVREALVAAGYEFVQAEPRMPDARNWRPDLVAWAADSQGALVPWAVVETKASFSEPHPELGLGALARARDILGTVDHYVVVNGSKWYRADPGLQRLSPVEGPVTPPNGGEGEISDVDLVTALLSDRLWKAAAQYRDKGMSVPNYQFNPGAILDFTGFQTTHGSWVPVSKEALWQARRRAIVDYERRGKEAGEFTSHKSVAKAVAQLAASRLTGDLLDPFCGAGSFLWESIDIAQEHATGLNTALGYDINQRTADVARSIGNVSPVPTDIIRADALRTDLRPSTCVVSAPPISLRMQEPEDLLDGSRTRDGDLIFLDRIVRALEAGGRAVVHLPLGFTFRGNAEGYRRFLAARYRVAAILGLPSGAWLHTGIRSVLVVIERAEPTDTFVAQLGDDWEMQLEPRGAAMEAALAHVDGAQK